MRTQSFIERPLACRTPGWQAQKGRTVDEAHAAVSRKLKPPCALTLVSLCLHVGAAEADPAAMHSKTQGSPIYRKPAAADKGVSKPIRRLQQEH